MKAWYGNPELKAEVLARMLQHRVEDSIIQGSFQQYDPELASQYRGCLIGCTLPRGTVESYELCCADCDAASSGPMYIEEQDWLYDVERMYGLPLEYNKLIERVFEMLPVEKAPWFAVASVEATPVGADMNQVVARLKEELRAKFPRTLIVRYVHDVNFLKAYFVNSALAVDDEDFHGETALWMAETIIRVLRESDPNPPVKTETPVVVVQQEVPVPVAA